MISHETRASGLLGQLSRARPMTAADLVVVAKAHLQLGSHSTVVYVRNVCSDPLQAELYIVQ